VAHALLSAAAVPTAQVEGAGPAGAGQQPAGGGALPGAGQKRRRVSPRDPRIASAAAAAGASCAVVEAEVMDMAGVSEKRAAGAEAAAEEAPEAAPEACPAAPHVHGPAPGAAPSPPTCLAAVQLPPLSSFAGDSGRPLKRRMLSKLQPLLEAAGASDQHLSGWPGTGARRRKSPA
jgi:hypothetical protein